MMFFDKPATAQPPVAGQPVQNQQPAQQGLFRPIPNILQAISGFANGNTVGDQFANVNNILTGQNAKSETDAIKTKTYEFLLAKSPELANAVKMGALAPEGAYAIYMKQQQDAIEAAKPKYQLVNIDGNLKRIEINKGSVESLGDFSDPDAKIPAPAKEAKYWLTHPDEYTAYQQQQTALKGDKTTTLQRDLQAAGIQPGTPEWNQAIIQHYKKSGMSIESDGKGGFRLIQGDVNTPGKLTEDQSKNIGWLERGSAANKELEDVGNELTSLGGYTADKIGVAGNYLKTPTYQKADRAGKDFLAVVLRKDSGGAITQDEIATYGRIYLPMPGDDSATLKAKADARATILDSIKAGLGGAANQTRQDPNQPAQKPVTIVNPTTGQRMTLQNGQWVPAQ